MKRQHFNKLYLLIILITSTAISPLYAQLNGSFVISGRVTDDQGHALEAVSVQILDTQFGSVTDSLGYFKLVGNKPFPFTLRFTNVGFAPKDVLVKSLNDKVSVQLFSQSLIANEVVVTASRQAEKLLRSPVTIEKLDIRALKETPAPSFYDALGNLKGIQLTTSSLTFKIPNARGFNIPNNFRFMQLVDGVDMQAATLGVPLGNAIGPTELDIASVEVTPGAASALYGMNAINGMANLITKNPFNSQGLSVYQRTGVNHVDGKDHAASVMTETAIRYAQAFNNKFAFKLNFSYLHGTDWVSNNATDQNTNDKNTANPGFPELNGSNNAAYDAWNKYGDENNNAVTVSGVNYQGSNQTFLVRRTGYWEKDLVHPQVDNLKADVGLYYRFKPSLELSYGYRVGKMDGIFQRGNKVQLDNVIVQNHRLELKGKNFSARTYVSIENTGDSYNLKPLSDNLDLTHLSNNAWRDKFKASLQNSLNNGVDLASAMSVARTDADAGRVEPGTPEFDQLKKTIIGINNWDHANAGIAGAPPTGGAWLKQRSRMYHADAQWDLSDKVKWFNLLVGGDLRIYEVIPDGNNFVDFSRPVDQRNKPVEVDGKVPDSSDFGSNVYYKKYGFFAQVTKTFFNEKLKVFASLRFDHNLEFSPKFNPRAAVVYSPNEHHNFRFAVQNGYRFPALFEALSFVNNGNVRRVGGLSFINEGLGYLDNSYTLTSVNNFNAAVNKDVTAGMTQNDAALKNRDLLAVTDLAPTQPEKIVSFEAGYKGVFQEGRLFVDLDFYHNTYTGFLGQVEVSVPKDGQVGSDEAVVDMLASNRSKQTRYRVFTNAKNTYRNYGSALAVTYRFYRKFTVSGNVSYNNIKTNKTSDVFVTAFNTPKWSTNLSVGNREIVKNLGFNVVWKWQDSFLWESPLANGVVPSFSTIDAQVTYRIPQWKATIKVGGSNLFNQRYFQYAAGPTIGGLYYTTIVLDGLFSKADGSVK
ncbi:TonB-dependent receptor [Flavihumibacter petaseus]|uniref:Putative TonB-dependent receptor n=1 Tax=Flavihumibacter petaseus NBRC 106054 TaxID=1220578 RepID=A0A0E9N1I9_9BACT|nr:TonB-dependent receptor [Flavihumibacter petaseus]GAO43882.1 putative TonB-dependent receptor [Flavihumibacter petaseus NBRC 106054]